jgi:hypothetical protein
MIESIRFILREQALIRVRRGTCADYLGESRFTAPARGALTRRSPTIQTAQNIIAIGLPPTNFFPI